ncbi:uncharacterized protein LOC113794107 isoform X3 [Dermatophagoides pteronyssinus]|uniref:uncharacterized protein LOC113794107 isoform X3 n=1 Tax=Dermatophagoides pteronyssinus TaxID=6956 RepID=UPI003F681C94
MFSFIRLLKSMFLRIFFFIPNFHRRIRNDKTLCSHDLAKQSRELVDDCLQQFGNNPDHAISMVNDYLDNNDNHCKSLENSTTNSSNSDDDNSKSSSLSTFKTSVSAIKNRRQSMEDRHIIIQNLNKALGLDLPKTYSYYAIFDGHAGIDAASYSTAHLHHYLVESEAFRNGQMEDAFRQAFHKTDELYTKRLREDGIDKLKPSGTTAICALIEDNKNVYLAWAGDSQAVLVRNGCHEEIMLPHKPDMESERIRIQDQGGLVIYMDTWRVNGILSVTRAIGDPEHKSLIIADPSFSTFQIDSSLDFLVLGCDGLFDHLNGQDITSNVFEYLCKNENNDPELVQQGVSAYLAEQAIQEGSSDNITSIVIFFKPFEQLIATGLYPTNQIESNQEESMIINDTNAAAAALPTTNGGHFPYTDFAELPIGINYKLTSNENLSSPTTTIDLDDQNYQSQSNNNTNDIIESSMELPESKEEQPIENNDDVDIDDNNLEHCQDEFDFVRTTTTPTETIILNDNNNQTKSIDIDDNNCLMVDEQQEDQNVDDKKEQEQQQQLKEELSSSSAATIMEKTTLLSDYNNDDNNNSGGVGGGKILSSIINDDDNNGENFDQHFNHHNDDHDEQQPQQQQQEENSKVLIEQSKQKSFMNEFDDNQQQQQQQMDQMDNFFNQSSFNDTNNMNNNPFDLLADQKTSTSSTNRTSINPFENSNANITIMSASPFDDNNDNDGDGDGDGGNIMNMEQSNNDQTEILSISNDPMMDMMMMINQSDSKIVDAALDSSYDNDDNELADDFMFVQPNRSTDESTNFPTATTTITENIPGTMISPMLLMNSQFESGLLYDQQEQQQQPEPETDGSCLIQNEPPVLLENDVDQPSTNDHFESNELKEPQEPVDFKQPEIICDIGTTTASAVEEGECSKSFEIQNDSMLDEKMIDIDLSAGQQQAPVTTTDIDNFVDEMSALTLQNNSEIMNIATNDHQKNGDILINNEMSNLNNEIINDNNLEDSKVVLDDQDQINHVERSVPKFEETNLDDNLVSLPPQSANEIQIPLVEPTTTTVDKKEEEISEKVLSEIQPAITAVAAAVAAASAVAVKSTVPSKATIKTASSTKLPATKPSTTTATKTTLSNTKKTGVTTKLSNSGTKTSLAPKTTNRLTTATAKSSSTTTASNKPTTIAKIGDKKPLTSTISSSRLTTTTNRSTTATNRPTASTTKSSTATALSAKPMRTALTTRTATTTTALKSTSTKPASTTSTTAASSVPKTTRPTTTTAATKTALKPRTAITSSTNVAAKKPMTTSTTGSKVGSIRPATKITTTTTTTNAINKPLASKATNITKKTTPITKSSAVSSTLKKTNNTQNDVKKTVPKIPRTSSTTTASTKSTTTNGVSNGDSGKNMAVPKKRPPPPPTPQQQPPTTLMTTSNYSHKRTSLISPENSLKQELEDAALNEMNANAALEAAAVAAATAAASASEQFNGSN